MPRKNGQRPPLEETSENQQNNNVDLENNAVDISDLLEQFSPDAGIDFKATLYRVLPTATKTKRTLVYSWENYIPDVTEIGELAGAGNFALYVRGVDSQGNQVFSTKSFYIDDIWDEIRARKSQDNTQSQTPTAQAPVPILSGGQFDLEKILKNVALIAAAIKPLFEIRAPQQNPVDLVQKLSELGAKLIESNFERSLEMQQKLLDRTAEQEREVSGEVGVREIVEMIQPYLAAIVAAPKTVLPSMVKPIANQEQVKAIAKNKVLVQALYQELCREAGPEKANIVAKNLGIKIIPNTQNKSDQENQGTGS